jgi:hypothetical protein
MLATSIGFYHLRGDFGRTYPIFQQQPNNAGKSGISDALRHKLQPKATTQTKQTQNTNSSKPHRTCGKTPNRKQQQIDTKQSYSPLPF